MQNIVVIGVGRMGSVIAWAMDKLGWNVVAVDSQPQALHELTNVLDKFDSRFCNQTDCLTKVLQEKQPEIVISALPFHQNEPIARSCVAAGVRYCDLGGRVDVSQNINSHALSRAKKPIMTDLGLAPGWVNILAEQGCNEISRCGKIEEVKMMVGGIPLEPQNHPLDYTVTWSIDGLVNEYRDDCKIISDGEIKIVKGMDGLELVKIKDLDGKELEAFYTSGGASHTIDDMFSRGVQNCSYKTLRYKGHRNIVKFLMRDCNLTDNCLREVFEKGCSAEISKDKGDLVIIKSSVKTGSVNWNREILVYRGMIEDSFSAMQQATAFPVAAVASLMAEGYFDNRKVEHRGYSEPLPLVLSYKDIPFDKFNENLKLLGVTV